jgi:hypothetical protein
VRETVLAVGAALMALGSLVPQLRAGLTDVLSPMLLIPIVALAPTGLPTSHSVAVTTAGMLVLAQVAVFFAIFVMTPNDVVWHTQSWARLVAQMWPTIVWWACARQTSAR